ncbi:hypothetical protein BH23BAC4_BH23BAC4_00800 [soil metagenome]
MRRRTTLKEFAAWWSAAHAAAASYPYTESPMEEDDNLVPRAASLNGPRIQISFDESPLTIKQIVHTPSGKTICSGGYQRFLLRLPKRASDPVQLTRVSDVSVEDEALTFTVADETDAFHARVRIEAGESGLRYSMAVSGPEPIWMAEWKMYGLDLNEVVVPALGGQALSREMPGEMQLSYKYPFWWNAQFALGELGNGNGGVWLRTTEVAPRFKVFRVHKLEEDADLFALGLGFEADAPVTKNTLEAEWTFDGYSGDWQQPTDTHSEWLREAFNLSPRSEHPHYPAWAEDINFVLEIWGMRNDWGRPAHTFDATIDRLKEFARLHPPGQTLLYLPGYAEEGVDSRIPDYNPGQKLGGDAGFKRLVDAAKGMGYRVMIHTNVLGMTYTHPRFAEFEKHQVVDPFGQKLGWGNDLDGDWLPEPYFAYINPGVTQWGDLMEKTLGRLINDFGLDAVFLDQTLLAFNDSEGPNFVIGMREHIARLQKAFPHVMFAGEGLHEQGLPVLPFVQIHGIDSISEIHGMEGERTWRRAHPVSTRLFGPFSRFMSHLLTKHPSSPGFKRQEEAYAELGVIPGLVLYRQTQEIDLPETHAMIARAQRLTATRTVSEAPVPDTAS